MGGVIGAVSPKFVIHAGLLLLSARLDRQYVQAVLDPSTSITTVSTVLARRLGIPPEAVDSVAVTRNRVIGLQASEFRVRSVRVTAQPQAAPITIGADLLAQTPILLDFGRGRLGLSELGAHGLLERGGLSYTTRGMAAAPLTKSPGGCLSTAGIDASGRRITVALAGTPRDDDRDDVTVRVGPVALKVQAVSELRSRCSVDAVIHWGAFGNRRIVLDVPHGSLWID